MNNNILKYGWCSWRYPRYWWKNIKMIPRHIKWAWQRITRGYADCDVWGMNNWLLDVISGALDHLAENHCGYPGTEQFPEDEEWTTYLKDMALKFYAANEENEYYPTPEREKWWKWYEEHDSIVVPVSDALNPYVNTMIKEDKELAEKRMQDFAEAWSMMGDVFWDLWD